MIVKVIFLSKSFIARMTFVRFFSLMNCWYMFHQALFLWKAEKTNLTAMIPFFFMNWYNMGIHLLFSSKFSLTNMTLKINLVPITYQFHHFFCVIFRCTALIRFSMSSQMSIKYFFLKRIWGHRTYKATFLSNSKTWLLSWLSNVFEIIMNLVSIHVMHR